MSDKFKYSDNSSKYFIGYLDDDDDDDNDDDDIIKLLSIILPQMSGYIKHFDDGGKNMSFKIENEGVYLEYNEIWNKIEKTLGIKFHSQPIYDDKYIKTKVNTFNGVINTVFSYNEIPKARNHYICMAAIRIDSIMKIDKKKTILMFIWNNLNPS